MKRIIITLCMLALSVAAIHACKVTIMNNTNTLYYLRAVPSGAPKELAPEKSISFGDSNNKAHFIVAEQIGENQRDIREVKQTTCGGDKSEKKLTIQGILSHRLGKHQDKFSIKKL